MKMNHGVGIMIIATVIMGSFAFFWRCSSVRKRNIAVLLGSSVLVHEKIYEGLLRGVHDSVHKDAITIVPYWFSGFEKMQVTAMCESALSSMPDLIISVGTIGTQVLHDLAKKRQSSVPIVCVGVAGSVAMGLMESLEQPGGNMTGVEVAGLDPLRAVKLLLITKPMAQKVLMPYAVTSDTASVVAEIVDTIQNYLQERGIGVTAVPLENNSDVLHKIKTLLPGHDVLFGVEYNTLTQQFSPGYAKLCNQMGVTFFCAIFDGVASGAAVTYALNTESMGVAAESLGEKILFEGRRPATLPVVVMTDSRELFINMKVATEQGYTPNIVQIKQDIESDSDLAWLKNRVNVFV